MTFEETVQEFCAAVEAGDGTRLAALFTEDGVYHDTFYGAFKGRDAIRGMLEDRFWGDAAGFKWEMRDPVSDGRHGYSRWVFSYTSKMAGTLGQRVVFEGMSCFELTNGLIHHYGEQFDSGLALAQLDFPPERLAKGLHKRAAAQNAKPELARHVNG